MHRRPFFIGGDRRFAIAVACLLTVLLCRSAISSAPDAGDAPPTRRAPEIPRPLRSRDLGNWMKEIAPADAERVKFEQAFDAYVDQWEQLRDQSVRPAQSKRDAAEGDATADAAWRASAARTYDAVSRIEGSMFDAMRTAKLDEDQKAKLDRIASTRARKRAGSAVRGVPVNLPKTPALKDLPAEKAAAIDQRLSEWERSATPLIERLAVASLDDKGADREKDLRRKVLAGERAAVLDIAALLPAEAGQKYAGSFRRQALSSGSSWGTFAMKTPESLRNRLGDEQAPEKYKEAFDKISQWQKQREALEEAALDTLTGDKVAPEAMAELESKYAQLNESSLADIAQAANMPDLAEPSSGMMISFNSLDDGPIDLGDLGDLGELSGGEGGAMMFSSVDVVGGAEAGAGVQASHSMFVMRGDGGGGEMMEGTSIRTMNVQMVVDESSQPGSVAIRRDSTPPELQVEGNPEVKIPPQMSEKIGDAIASAVAQSIEENNGPDTMAGSFHGGMIQMRPLNRQEIEGLRVRLAVPDAKRAVWDALATDLLQNNSEWLKGAPAGGFPIMVGEDLATYQKQQGERVAALSALEDAWFDDMKTGVQGIDPVLVDRERGRRALERVFASTRSSAMPMPDMMMSRWGRVDLYKAADALSPEARARAMPSIDAWCQQMQQELAPFPDRIADFNLAQRSHMNIISSDDGAGKVSMSMNVDSTGAAEIEKLRKPITEAWKHVEQTQMNGVDTVAAALGEPDAKLFRRAVRQQTHPEVFKTQEKVNQAVERVTALPSISPAQLKAVNALMDDYRLRCDTLIERSIEHTDKSDAGIARMMQGPSSSKKAEDGVKEARAMQVTERMRGDASYDREELNASALRRLRAALTEEQAKAAKLN
ncbi:MAG: hypothetical protein K8R92_11755 [Planctomycetes bacterium]|nr:hypothetical protein [Planctomycetota bacterium]